ncbi:hypothetical protein ACFL1X_01480 [Candidatus Hydrogenedentota bacterium]
MGSEYERLMGISQKLDNARATCGKLGRMVYDKVNKTFRPESMADKSQDILNITEDDLGRWHERIMQCQL